MANLFVGTIEDRYMCFYTLIYFLYIFFAWLLQVDFIFISTYNI